MNNNDEIEGMAEIKRKNYHIYNHQGKGNMFADALQCAGYSYAQVNSSHVILTDVDIQGRVGSMADQIKKGNSFLFCYPHSARPFIGWDGLFSSSQHTCASFVFADGHIDVIRAYGYKKPLHSVGWAYSEIKEFQPVENPRNILFAPIHPNNNGWLSFLDKQINARVYKILLGMIEENNVNLTVRHIKPLETGGLWTDKRVKYVRGDANTEQKDDMRNADVIIGHQTYAWIAVAMGKPTIMMAEYEAPRNGGSDATFKKVSSWEKYKDLLMYPLDILDTDDPYGLIRHACETDKKIRDWRCRMIGNQPFDSRKFVGILESYL